MSFRIPSDRGAVYVPRSALKNVLGPYARLRAEDMSDMLDPETLRVLRERILERARLWAEARKK